MSSNPAIFPPARSTRPARPRGTLATLALAALVAIGGGAAAIAPAQAAAAGPSPAAAAPVEARIGRVIVTYRDDTAALPAGRLSAANAPAWQAERSTRLAERLRLDLRAGRAISERQHVVMARGLSDEELAARLAGQPEVAFAEPDRRLKIAAVPNDPRYDTVRLVDGGPIAGQWYLKPPDATIFSAIDAQSAWDVPGVGGTRIVVAVLDTGIRFDHPDLPTRASGGMLQGYDMIVADDSFTGGNANFGTAADGDGRDADPSDPGDFLTPAEISANPTAFTNCSPEASSSWHGTQVAGIIGAVSNNGLGMAGVGRGIALLPVRVLGKCGGYTSDIAAGIRWAAGLAVPGVPLNPAPARVINLSLGGQPGPCASGSALQTAVSAATAAGTVVVAAAGNIGLASTSPANCPGAVGVAGVRHTGTKVGYSALGADISIAAPAGNCVNLAGACLYPILSTTNAGTTTPAPGSDRYTTGGSDFAVGTSFASPLAAGVAALMLSTNQALTSAQVRSFLQASARPFPATGADPGTPFCQAPGATEQGECYCTTATCGAGLLDARAAVQAAATGVPPVVTPPPPPPSGGGGGGGALGVGWVLALAAAAGALRRARRWSA
jgi:serine protease